MFNRGNNSLRQILVISGLMMVLTVNFLANFLPIAGKTTGELSDSYSVYFVPAGYVFSIWGLIYLFQLAFIIYQALPSQKDSALQRRVAPWYLLSCVFNSAWIFLWHYQLVGASLIAMLGILVSLVAIYVLLGTGRYETTRAETWLLRVPFSLYLAWITVATVANVTTWLESIGWDGFGLSEVVWGVIILIVATLIESVMALRFRDLAYVGVILWAFVGIAVKHSDTLAIAITAGLMAVVVAAAFFIAQVRKPNATVV